MAKNPTDTTLPPGHDDGAELETETQTPQPARRPRRNRTAAPPPDSALDELDDAALDEEARIAEILRDELNNSANLEIYRKDKAGRWAFLDVQPLNDWNAEAKVDLARKYGGGEYKGRVRRQADGVRGTWGPSFHFTIDTSLRPKEDAPAAPGMDVEKMMSLMNQSDKTMPLFMQMMQMQQQASAAMMMQMQKSNETLVTVLTAALRPQPPAPPMSEKLVEILATKALNPAPQQRGIGDLAEVIKAVAQLKNIANADRATVDGEPEPKAGILDSLIEAVPSLLKMLGGLMPPEQVAPAPRQVEALPAQPLPTAPMPVPQATGLPPNEAFRPVEADIVSTGAPVSPRNNDISKDDRDALQAFLPSLVQAADAGQPAPVLAEHIGNTLPDSVFFRLVDLLKRDDWMAVLIDAYEPVAIRSPFFTELRNELIAMSEDDGLPEGGGN